MLEPEIGPDFGGLSEWPRDQVVKVLCFCHPDDDAATWAAQEATILRLFNACRRNRLEFLLEVIPSKVGAVDDDTTARMIQRFYDLGVYPDWWKLEPMTTEAAWEVTCEAINRNDPHTRGIVVLGLGERGRAGRRVSRRRPGIRWSKASPSAARSLPKPRRHGCSKRSPMIGLSAPWPRISPGFAPSGTRRAASKGTPMSKTIRLTAAQAMVRYLAAQMTEEGEPFIAGCWAIFGHGNVAGIGEALHGARDSLPTYRGHNEQTMAHAAIAYAKQLRRKRAMAVTSSIGPGATNMVTAAALAHVNRLPVLLIPGDVFANRGPDPVLQQIEDFGDGTVSANDCFRPVSRYFDRITRPEQLLTALPRAFRTMTDPADCGPVTLAFCQDVQAEAYD